jgi:muramoyltetrapeptide carboxypeptidase LdcA involved in peptidoglycan recycling
MDSLDRLKKRFTSLVLTDDTNTEKLLQNLMTVSTDNQVKSLLWIANRATADVETSAIWNKVDQLYQTTKEPRVISACLEVLLSLITSSYEKIDILRKSFFIIISHADPSNMKISVNSLSALSKNGKDIRHFEYEFGSLLVKWLQQITG